MIDILAAAIVSSAVRVNPCDEFTTPLVKAALNIYVDPSEKNRRLATADVLDATLPLISASQIHSNPDVSYCVRSLKESLLEVGSYEILRPRFDAQVAEYRKSLSEAPHDSRREANDPVASAIAQAARDLYVDPEALRFPSKRPRADVLASIKNSRATCRFELPGRCTVAAAAELIWSGDSDTSFLVPFLTKQRPTSETEALLLWQKAFEKGGNRRDRLTLILNAPADGFPAQRVARSWALDELVGARDPRTWAVDDIAVVIASARREDSANSPPTSDVPAGPTSRLGVDSGVRGPSMDGFADEHEERLFEILSRLAPLGIVRAFEIVMSRHFPVPGPGDKPVWEHVGSELAFYAREWNSAHPKAESGRLTPAEASDLESYKKKRWWETERRAPSPDLRRLPDRLREVTRHFDELVPVLRNAPH